MNYLKKTNVQEFKPPSRRSVSLYSKILMMHNFSLRVSVFLITFEFKFQVQFQDAKMSRYIHLTIDCLMVNSSVF